HLLADVPDEGVADPDVRHRANQRTSGRPDRQAEYRDEEDQAEQQSPEAAAECSGSPRVAQLASFRLLLAHLPADDGRVKDLDELLTLQIGQRVERVLRAVGGLELPDS